MPSRWICLISWITSGGGTISNENFAAAGDYTAWIQAKTTSAALLLYDKLEITIYEQPTAGWARTWGGWSDDYCVDIAVDEDGNSYNVGFYYGTADFDPGPGVVERTHDEDGSSFIVKINSAGQFQWVHTWAVFSNACGVTLDGSGNVYVTGLFSDGGDLDPGPGVDKRYTGEWGFASFLMKFGTDGTFVWAKTYGGDTFGGNEGLVCAGIVTDLAGSIYVTGHFEGTADFDPGPVNEFRTSNGKVDAYLSKFDMDGNLQWVHTWGGTEGNMGYFSTYYDSGYGLAIETENNIFVSGNFKGSVDFDPSDGVDIQEASQGAFLSKFSSDGSFVWARTWGGNDYPFGIAYTWGLLIDGSGNLFLGGMYNNTLDFDPGPGIY